MGPFQFVQFPYPGTVATALLLDVTFLSNGNIQDSDKSIMS